MRSRSTGRLGGGARTTSPNGPESRPRGRSSPPRAPRARGRGDQAPHGAPSPRPAVARLRPTRAFVSWRRTGPYRRRSTSSMNSQRHSQRTGRAAQGKCRPSCDAGVARMRSRPARTSSPAPARARRADRGAEAICGPRQAPESGSSCRDPAITGLVSRRMPSSSSSAVAWPSQVIAGMPRRTPRDDPCRAPDATSIPRQRMTSLPHPPERGDADNPPAPDRPPGRFAPTWPT
jgi:hypothetical protein